MQTRYYHGTRISAAVEALSAGGPLLARRPSGASRFARSRTAAVYLTPSFNQAAEYAWMGTDRRDWPSSAEARLTTPHVFAFDLPAGHPGMPCEDELGWAVRHALLKARGERGDWSMNDAFATAYDADADAAARVLEAAAGFAPALAKLGDPATWRGSQKTRAGALLARSPDAGLLARMVAIGVSVSHPEGPVPIGGYLMERRVMRVEDAVAIPVGEAGAEAEAQAFSPS